jgi:hypothetical protein
MDDHVPGVECVQLLSHASDVAAARTSDSLLEVIVRGR